MKKSKAVVHFPVKNLKLTANEKKVLEHLVAAADAIGPIYEEQENSRYLGSSFYPASASKEEILGAAKNKPEILSPYTIVERNREGDLITIPYHIKYKDKLEIVAKHLRGAAKITERKDFAQRLYLQANALLDGNYEASDIYWLTMKPYKIDIAIGPLDKLDDRLLFKKTSYEAWVGVEDTEATKKAGVIQHAIYDVKRKIFTTREKAEFLEKTKMRVEKTLVFSGLFARGMFTSNSLPIDPGLMEKYGIRITFFDTSLDVKFLNQHYPIYQRIFEKNFQKEYSRDLLREASFRNVHLHEIGHSLLRFKDSERRLRENFPIIDELSATIYGIKSCGSLVLKGIMTEKEIEAIMIMFVCRAFTWWLDSRRQKSVEAFAIGHAIALNHFISTGALRESEGISWPNFTKMFMAIEELSDSLERLISIGNYSDANAFIEKYGSFMVYSRFASRLKGMT